MKLGAAVGGLTFASGLVGVDRDRGHGSDDDREDDDNQCRGGGHDDEDGADDRGHWNDGDGHDEDNPGKSDEKLCRQPECIHPFPRFTVLPDEIDLPPQPADDTTLDAGDTEGGNNPMPLSPLREVNVCLRPWPPVTREADSRYLRYGVSE